MNIKIKHNILLLLSILFVRISTTYGQVTSYDLVSTGGFTEQKGFKIDIPFEIDSSYNKIIMPLKIKDTILSFAFDSGSGISVINPNIEKILNKLTPSKKLESINVSDGRDEKKNR